MNGCDWIICERTSRWAAAVRTTLDRTGAADQCAPRIYEARSQRDVVARLAARPDALVALEIDYESLAESLAWLAAARRQFPRARFVAMLDRSLGEDLRAGNRSDEAFDVAHALVEAGAALVVRSPGESPALVGLACRHAVASAADRAAARDDLSLAEQVWASLPWQDPTGRVG